MPRVAEMPKGAAFLERGRAAAGSPDHGNPANRGASPGRRIGQETLLKGELAPPAALLQLSPSISSWLQLHTDLLPGFGWMDGGCLVLALAFKRAAARRGVAVAVHAFHRNSAARRIEAPDHFLARPLRAEGAAQLYFDGDGFATLEGALRKMREQEGLTGYVRTVPDEAVPRFMKNPHYWHSPRVVAEMADRIEELYGEALFPPQAYFTPRDREAARRGPGASEASAPGPHVSRKRY